MRAIRIVMIFSLVLSATVAAAQGTCSTEMLQGSYAVEHTGLIYMGVNMPYTLLGVLTADANGKTHARWAQVNPFFAAPLAMYEGQWTVTPDCKVTFTQTGAGSSEGVVVNNGDEIRMMMVSPLMRVIPPPPMTGGQPYPGVGSGIMRRMTPGIRVNADGTETGSCSTKMLRGTYAQSCNGYMPQPGTPTTFMPYRASMLIESYGDGTFGGGGTLAAGGQALPFIYKEGTTSIEIGENCWGTATFQVLGRTETWTERVLLWDNGKEMLSTTTGPTGQVDVCRFTRIR